MHPSSQQSLDRHNSRTGTGTAESLGAISDTASILDVTGMSRPVTPRGTPTPSLNMENIKPRNELIIKHKTKVSKVKPLGRIAYEWEWDITKFDKAFPLLSNGGMLPGSAGKTKILKSEKLCAGAEIGRKSDWNFLLSEANGRLSWHILLSKIRSNYQSIHAAFSFRIVDSTGKELLPKSRCFFDFGERFQFGWNDVIDLETLYTQKDTFLVDNTLRIRVLFEMYADATQRETESAKQEKDDFAKIVTNDLNRLRTATGTADVHLECEGKVFPVHKLILSARSTAFARMFEATLPKPSNSQNPRAWAERSQSAGGDNPPDTENLIAIVAIPDVEAHILEVVLDYVYSGNVIPLTNPVILSGVIQAADKFELRDLKAYCFNALMNFLNEDNIGQLSVLAHRHHAGRNVRMNINSYCLRHLAGLMKKKSFRDALKMEPDAFFPDDECL